MMRQTLLVSLVIFASCRDADTVQPSCLNEDLPSADEVLSLLQYELSTKVLELREAQPHVEAVQASMLQRWKMAWRSVIQIWHLDLYSGDSDVQVSLLANSDDQALKATPEDLWWMTTVPCIIAGVAITGLIMCFVRETLHQSEKKDEDLAGDIKGMSDSQLLFNMVKNMVGEGMLSLPAGIAAGTGLFMGSLIALGFCTLMGYTFCIMGRTCHATGEMTHKDCGSKLSGPIFAQTMAVVLMFKTLFTCLTYAIVIGESFSRIVRFFGVDGICSTPSGMLILTVLLILLPLCLQKDLSVLSYTSMIGICGEVWVVMFMQIRFWDKSYASGGPYHDLIPKQDRPDFSNGGVLYWQSSASTFVLLGSLSTAFIAHYNAPKFYSQLRNPSPERFSRVVAGAFALSMIIYFWIMAVGYLTFGTASQGLILNNYSEKDSLATTARLAIGFAVTFGFPLGFTGLRDATMSVFGLSNERYLPITISLLIGITAFGCSFHDLGLVNSLGGAIFGALITLVFPGLLCHMAGSKREINEFSVMESKLLAPCVVALGMTLVVFGSTIVVIARYFPEVLKS